MLLMLVLKVFRTAKNKCCLQWGWTWWLLDQGPNAYPTELTWHVVVRGSLSWLLFIHLLSEFGWISWNVMESDYGRILKSNSSFTLHGTGNGNETGNDGFMYFAMYCSHYTGTGTETGNRNGDHWVPYPFSHSLSQSQSQSQSLSRSRAVWMSH